MSTTTPAQVTALHALCETAARALRCSVHLSLAPEAGGAWRVTFDPASGTCTAEQAPFAVGDEGGLCVSFRTGGGTGQLRFASATGREWSPLDQALAESFAPLAALAADRDREDGLRDRVLDLERQIQEVQAIAELGSYEWHTADNRIEWSAEQERIHGLEPGGHPRTFEEFLALVHPDDRARVAELTRTGLEERRPVEAGYRIVRPDGEVRELLARSRIVVDAYGQPVRLVGTAHDVTQLRAIERELRTANERLEQRVAERTAALADASEALQQGEARFRRILENGTDLVLVADPNLNLTYVSPSVERLVGYTPEEMLLATPQDMVHPEDVGAVVAETLNALENPGTLVRIAWRIRHRDGGWRLLDAIGRTVDPHSSAHGVLINARDITEQRAAEAELVRQKAYFEEIIGCLETGVAVFDPELRFEYVSPNSIRDPELRQWAVGRTVEEYGRRLGLPMEVMRQRVDSLARAAAERCTTEFEEEIRGTDGTPRHMLRRSLPLLDERGELVRIIGYSVDITERKRAEQALQRSEEHFRRLIENGSDLLMISAPDGALSYVSPSVERLLGYRPEELIGLTPAELVHADDIPLLMECIDRIVREPGTAQQVTWRIRHKDGSWRVFESFGKTLSPDGGEAGVVVNGRDVTARRAADEALRLAKIEAERAREEAERANVAKSEFLSRMSHELRTPLNSILGFAQVLEDVEMPPEYQTGVRHIINGGRHLLSLINEVLDIARIEADRQPMSMEPVRLGAIVHEAVDMVRPLAAARGIWVAEIPHPSAERYVRADRQRLAQVLLNLLSNAVKYNRPAGAVRIGCEPVAGAAGKERLRIRVEDEGSGIAPEHRDQLFVPFARLGAEHSGVEGTGLGLALSQRLARAMGGELSLERSGPEGSVFSVDLEPAPNPLADVPALVAHADRCPDPAHPEATLLYVEDNLANLSLVETILLPRPGWRVLPALQGGLGLELALRHAPDVVLLDLHLPDIPGREVLRQLRAEPATAHIPVVVISADATPRTVEALLAEGAEAFLTKPINIKEFLATVERLLARPRLGA